MFSDTLTMSLKLFRTKTTFLLYLTHLSSFFEEINRLRFAMSFLVSEHRLTLNRDILAATLILALSSVFTSAGRRNKKRYKCCKATHLNYYKILTKMESLMIILLEINGV